MPYATIARRETRAGKLADGLIEAGRIQLLDCGRHALIPTLERHRIAGGNTSERVKAEHERLCSGRVRTPSPDKSRSESLSPSLSESPSPPRRGRGNGSKNPDEERDEAIGRARAKLEDPGSSDDMKRAARFALEQLGAPA
jgi:hypothetical protein